MQVEIRGTSLPGRRFCAHGIESPYENVHVGVQRRNEVVDLHPGDAPAASWLVEVALRPADDGSTDFGGPYVHGKRGERFLYLSWGTVTPEAPFTMFRRAKLMLADVDAATIEAARRPGGRLVATLGLTGGDGGPRCAAVRPPAVAWSAAPG